MKTFKELMGRLQQTPNINPIFLEGVERALKNEYEKDTNVGSGSYKPTLVIKRW